MTDTQAVEWFTRAIKQASYCQACERGDDWRHASIHEGEAQRLFMEADEETREAMRQEASRGYLIGYWWRD